MPAPTALPIALKLGTIRHAMAAGPEQALEQVASIGYNSVELSGLHGRSAKDLRRLLDQHGLKAVAAHEALPRGEGDDAEAARVLCDRARTLGYTHVVIGHLPRRARCPRGYRAAAERMHRLADRLANRGLTLAYHHHDDEFARGPGGERGIDVLLSGGAVAAELDVYWLRRAGDDPLVWIRRLAGRVPLLSMKDAPPPVCAAALAGLSHGVRYLVVGHGSHPHATPLESARAAYDNLSHLLA